MTMNTGVFEDFRLSCRKFIEQEAMPYQSSWEEQGLVDRSFWLKLGEAGLLGMGVSTEYGGQNKTDFRYPAIFTEELIRVGMTAPIIISHNDVIASYLSTFGTEEQKQRWLPDLCNGKLIAAIAITEPSGGSDSAEIKTTAKLGGDHYLLNGSKAYITNGINADIIVIAVKTDAGQRGQGISLLVVERDTPGFSRGEALNKLGWHASDTAALCFKDCLIPKNNLIGRENLGSFYFMTGMTRERISISSVAVASAESALTDTLAYVKERQAFGQAIGSFQYNRFMLAQLDTEVKIARIYLDDAIKRFNDEALSLDDAARLKLWTTELQVKVADRCLQLHGGSAYMSDSLIGKNWVNSRIQKIYGGTSEILMEVISKSMGL